MDVLRARKRNLALLARKGFRAAASLPVERDAPGALRKPEDIAKRLMALDAVFTWVSASETDAPAVRVREYAKRNGLERWMTPAEKAAFRKPRAAARRAHVATIGWTLENMWPLAWALGFAKEPSIDGKMIDGKTMRAILLGLMPRLGETVDVLLGRAKPRSRDEVLLLEDRFYCCHNAVRSAQLGSKTVPKGFHPVVNGGVIHERRHALTWCLSPETRWQDVDLST